MLFLTSADQSSCIQRGVCSKDVAKLVIYENVRFKYTYVKLHLHKMELVKITNLFRSWAENVNCTWVNTCRSVLNFRDVSSFFLSLSSSRVAYSTICFCCSAIFALQFFKSLRISDSWLLYRFMPCLILRMRFRRTMFDCGGDTLGSKREEGSSEQCGGEPSSPLALPVFPLPLRGVESRHINGLLTLLEAAIRKSRVSALKSQRKEYTRSKVPLILLTGECTRKIQKIGAKVRYFR